MTPERLRQIEDLYHAACEASAGERAVLLAGTDPELRRQVESLLSLPPGGVFLDRPAIEHGTGSGYDRAGTERYRRQSAGSLGRKRCRR